VKGKISSRREYCFCDITLSENTDFRNAFLKRNRNTCLPTFMPPPFLNYSIIQELLARTKQTKTSGYKTGTSELLENDERG